MKLTGTIISLCLLRLFVCTTVRSNDFVNAEAAERYKAKEAEQGFTYLTGLPSTIENLKEALVSYGHLRGGRVALGNALKALRWKVPASEMTVLIDDALSKEGQHPDIVFTCARCLETSFPDKAANLYERVLAAEDAPIEYQMLSAESLVELDKAPGYVAGIKLVQRGLGYEGRQDITDGTMSLLKVMKDREGQTINGVLIDLQSLRAEAVAKHKIDRSGGL